MNPDSAQVQFHLGIEKWMEVIIHLIHFSLQDLSGTMNPWIPQQRSYTPHCKNETADTR